MYTDEDVQFRLKELLKVKTLNDVKKQDFPFASLGTLARIRDGQFPKTIKLREAFELQPLIVVPTCSRCGGIHTRKCAAKKDKQKRVLKATKDVAMMLAYAKFLDRRQK